MNNFTIHSQKINNEQPHNTFTQINNEQPHNIFTDK